MGLSCYGSVGKSPFPMMTNRTEEESFNKVAGCLHSPVPCGHHRHIHTSCNGPRFNELMSRRAYFTCSVLNACCYKYLPYFKYILLSMSTFFLHYKNCIFVISLNINGLRDNETGSVLLYDLATWLSVHSHGLLFTHRGFQGRCFGRVPYV